MALENVEMVYSAQSLVANYGQGFLNFLEVVT